MAQLNERENRLDALKREIKKLEADASAAQGVFEKMIQDLVFDVRL